MGIGSPDSATPNTATNTPRMATGSPGYVTPAIAVPRPPYGLLSKQFACLMGLCALGVFFGGGYQYCFSAALALYKQLGVLQSFEDRESLIKKGLAQFKYADCLLGGLYCMAVGWWSKANGFVLAAFIGLFANSLLFYSARGSGVFTYKAAIILSGIPGCFIQHVCYVYGGGAKRAGLVNGIVTSILECGKVLLVLMMQAEIKSEWSSVCWQIILLISSILVLCAIASRSELLNLSFEAEPNDEDVKLPNYTTHQEKNDAKSLKVVPEWFLLVLYIYGVVSIYSQEGAPVTESLANTYGLESWQLDTFNFIFPWCGYLAVPLGFMMDQAPYFFYSLWMFSICFSSFGILSQHHLFVFPSSIIHAIQFGNNMGMTFSYLLRITSSTTLQRVAAYAQILAGSLLFGFIYVTSEAELIDATKVQGIIGLLGIGISSFSLQYRPGRCTKTIDQVIY